MISKHKKKLTWDCEKCSGNNEYTVQFETILRLYTRANSSQNYNLKRKKVDITKY